jgi:hypothetical protein
MVARRPPGVVAGALPTELANRPGRSDCSPSHAPAGLAQPAAQVLQSTDVGTKKADWVEPMRLDDVSRLAAQLDGVNERRCDGLLEWRYGGRLVARQLDDGHVVIRASFDFRDLLLQSFPKTFSVPRRFAKHRMIVADLEDGNADAIEDAVIAAWELQSGGNLRG